MGKPDEFSPEWNDWVMSLFTEDELVYNKDVDEKLPRAIGLRRVSQFVHGAIKRSGPVELVIRDRDEKTTITYEVEFDNGRVFGDVAECWAENTPVTFMGHPAATACTRAESRVLKKALGLKGLTAEEMTHEQKEVQREVVSKREDGVTDQQVALITKRCAGLQIDMDKFVSTWDDKNYNSIYDVPKSVAAKMVKAINTYQNGADIPEEIKV
jgi:hypothetical protein